MKLTVYHKKTWVLIPTNGGDNMTDNKQDKKFDAPWEHPDVAGVVNIFNGRVTKVEHKDMIIIKEDKYEPIQR